LPEKSARWLRTLTRSERLIPWEPGTPRITPRELLVAFGVLLAVATAIYLPHVFTGGFYTDDWFFLQRLHFIDRGGGSLKDMLDIYGNWPDAYRPAQTAMLVGQYLLTGDSPRAHLLLSVPLAAIQSFALYLVLRMLGLTRLVAGPAALLLAIGFFIDTTRLWETLQVQMAASTLYLAGLACALRGLRAGRGAGPWIWHAVALLLYLASAFTYEGMLVVIPLSFLAYLVVADRRSTLRLLAVDLPAFAVTAVIVGQKANEARAGDSSISHLWDRLRDVFPGAAEVFEASFPGHQVLFGPAGIAVALLVGMGVWLAIGGGGTLARASRQWCLIGAAALVLALIGLIPLLPGPDGLTPSNEGFANRLLIASAPFYPVLIVAVAFLVAIGILGLVRRPQFAVPLAMVLIAGIVAQSVVRERQRQDRMAAVWREEKRILDRVEQTVPDPMPGMELITFRHPVTMPGGFVSFGDYFDLDGALKLRYENESIMAHPFLVGGVCDDDAISFADITFSPEQRLSYDNLYFVDTARRQLIRIPDRDRCTQELARLTRPRA
jgi:hypothetical protein